MSLEENPSNWKTSLIRYIVWFLASAGILADIYILRGTYISLAAWIGAMVDNAQRSQGLVPSTSTAFTIDAIGRVLLLVLAVVGVTFAILIEYYLRKGEEKGKLYQRIRVVVATEVFIALIGIFIQVLTQLLV